MNLNDNAISIKKNTLLHCFSTTSRMGRKKNQHFQPHNLGLNCYPSTFCRFMHLWIFWIKKCAKKWIVSFSFGICICSTISKFGYFIQYVHRFAIKQNTIITTRADIAWNIKIQSIFQSLNVCVCRPGLDRLLRSGFRWFIWTGMPEFLVISLTLQLHDDWLIWMRCTHTLELCWLEFRVARNASDNKKRLNTSSKLTLYRLIAFATNHLKWLLRRRKLAAIELEWVCNNSIRLINSLFEL